MKKLNQPLIQHGIDDLDEAGNIGTVHQEFVFKENIYSLRRGGHVRPFTDYGDPVVDQVLSILFINQ